MDAVAPAVKVSGSESAFPGVLGKMEIAGRGRTHRLDGLAVLQTGSRQGIQEGIVDMSGPGSEYGIFSKTINVVLICTPFENMSDIEFDRTTRIAALEAAEYLAATTRGLVPDLIDEFRLDSVEASTDDLPRVCYIYHLQSQGVLRDTFVYGENARALLPTVLHPNEVLDGAIISSNYIIACQKNPTYLHQNNPVIRELYRRHGTDLYFSGVIIANEHNTLKEKERSAKFAAKLAVQLGANGVVMSQEGGGHADTDLMLCCAECEKLGIRTVMLLNEIAGAEGDQQSLVDTVPQADAVVTTGNNDEVIRLPRVERVIGGSAIAGTDENPEGALTLELARIYTSTNQLGAGLLTVLEY
jgi:glycine reductase